MRYAGQSHELRIPLRTSQGPGETFAATHEQRYGRRFANRALEIVNVRVRLVAPAPLLPLVERTRGPADPAAAQVGETALVLPGGQHVAPVYQRALLQPGHRFAGPSLVVQDDCTVYVAPGWHAEVDAWENLLLTLAGA